MNLSSLTWVCRSASSLFKEVNMFLAKVGLAICLLIALGVTLWAVQVLWSIWKRPKDDHSSKVILMAIVLIISTASMAIACITSYALLGWNGTLQRHIEFLQNELHKADAEIRRLDKKSDANRLSE